MGLNLAAMEKITADVQMNDLKWVEVGEGSYFKVLTVHEPTNTVAFSYKMDAGAPDFPSHFHICRAYGLDDSRVVWVPRVRKSRRKPDSHGDVFLRSGWIIPHPL